MRSKAERRVQLRNALAASAFSMAVAAVLAVIAKCCFISDAGIIFIVFVTGFALTLAVLILLWKKTGLIRDLFYLAHCIRNPESKRVFYCPCCGRRFAGFTDMKFYDDVERFDPDRFEKQMQDVMCPFCYSAPRQRILAVWAEENKELLKGAKILYFAPEHSMMNWLKKNGVKVTTADLFQKDVDLKLDITDISLPDGSYDMVICNHVLEHVSNYEKALSELNRILKPCGILIISFPIDPALETVLEKDAPAPEDRIRIFGQNDHVRLFGKDSRELIEKYGFKVSVIDTGKMPETILPVTGPADYDSNIIFSCIKETGNLEKTGIKDEN